MISADSLREIGAVLEVSESRVCQLHTQAIARLRSAVVGDSKPVTKVKRGRKAAVKSEGDGAAAEA